MIEFESLSTGDLVRVKFRHEMYRPETWRYLVVDKPGQKLLLELPPPDGPYKTLGRNLYWASSWKDVGYAVEATLEGKASQAEWFRGMEALLTHTYKPMTGTDPEVFLETLAGKPIPAWTKLPSKAEVGGKFLPFWDGFQAEFRTSAYSCQEELGIILRNSLTEVKAAFPYARIATKSVVEFTPEELEAASETQAAFGCEPSLNAYGHMGQQIPNPKDFPLRFAGGHIHYGVKKFIELPDDEYDRRLVETVKFMDMTVGLLGVSLAHGLDDPRRRHFYGLAGEYRKPPHGLEYRVLSNYWLIAGPAIYHLTFNVARAACQLGMHGMSKNLLNLPEDEVVAAINWSDARMARRLIRRGKDFWMALLKALYGSQGERTWPYLFQSVRDMGIDLDPKATLDRWKPLAPKESSYPPQWRQMIQLWNHDQTALAATAESYAEPQGEQSSASSAT